MENIQSKKYFWILLDVFIGVAVINMFFFVMPAIQKFGESFAPAHILTVSAEGKTTVSPDIAKVYFSVVSQGTNPEKLSSDSNEKMSAVISNIKSNGVDAKDIQTTDYNLQPNYSYDKNTGRSYIYNYTLTQTVFVKIRDLKKVATVIAGATPLGVNQMGNISFMVDDPDKVLAPAREEAFAKAKAKAMEMAAANGASIGRVVNISEYRNSPMPYFEKSYAMGMGGGGVATPSDATIEPGSQELTVNVSVTYSLR